VNVDCHDVIEIGQFQFRHRPSPTKALPAASRD
jgi:hypothetical protein